MKTIYGEKQYTNSYYTHQEFLENIIKKTNGNILEIGSGHGSTPFILELIKDSNRKLVSLETNPDWYKNMSDRYPTTDNHIWEHAENYNILFEKYLYEKWSIVFIDSEPWESRADAIRFFYNKTEYILIHDADYLLTHNLIDPNQYFNNVCMCYPKEPYPYVTGPPTMVCSLPR